MLTKPVPAYIMVALAALLWGGEYIRRDLWEPDEARFALVAREMRDGHWLVPFRQGEFYSHKPPLMFWLINAFSLFTGGTIGNLAARMPSFLGAVLAMWTSIRIATLWFSVRAGWYTLLLLPTSYLFWNKGGFGQIDMLLCGLEMMALYLLFTANISPNRSRLMAAYSFMGLGILAKGPVGLIIPLGIYIAVSLTTKKPIARPRSHFVWGPVLALIFPGLWLLAAWWSGAPEGFFHELLFKQNVGRLSGEFGGHVKPFYYFLYYFPLDFLPWTLALPLSWRALGQDRQTRSGRLALLAWMVFVILFFSLSSSKRNLYILSVYPAAAIMVAAGIDHWSFVSRSMIRATFWSLWVLLLLIGLAMAASVFVHNVPINTVMLLPGGLTMLAGCWWTYDLFQARKEAPGWLAAMSSIVMINFASIGLFVYPEFNAFKIPDEIIHVAHDNLAPTDRIIMYKQHGEIFSLYAERKGIMLYSQTELASFINQASQKNHMILALDRELPDIVSVVGEGHETHRFRMGNKRLVWLLIKRESEL